MLNVSIQFSKWYLKITDPLIIRDQRKVAVSWAKDEESWLMNKTDWWIKLIDEENWFTKKVNW